MEKSGHESTEEKLWTYRKKFYTYLLLVSGEILGILGLIFLALFIFYKYPLKWDLTSTKKYSLSQKTVKILNELREPVKVLAFIEKGSPEIARMREIFERYHRASANFQYEFVDVNKDLAKVQKYKVRHVGEVILEYQGRTTSITQVDEYNITNALIKLSHKITGTIYVTTGHGELEIEGQPSHTSMTQLVSALKDRGYKIEKLSILERGTIPDDAILLIIPNPQKDLLPDEVSIIREYLNRGGRIIITLSTTREAVPNLLSLVEYGGLRYDDGYILSKESSQIGRPITLVVPTRGVPGFKDVENLILLFPISRRISTALISRKKLNELNMTVLPVLYGVGMYKRRDEFLNEISKGQVTFDPNRVTNHVIAVKISRRFGSKGVQKGESELERSSNSEREGKSSGEENKLKEWVIYFIADGEFLSDSYINFAANMDFMLSLIDNLVGTGEGFQLQPKKSKPPEVITKRDLVLIFLVSLGLPVIIAGIGIAVVLSRKLTATRLGKSY